MHHKETRFGSSSRDPGPPENPRLVAHPGELVICKKKRKDREKSAVKSGGSAGPVSPMGRSIRSPGTGSGSGSGPRDTRLSQQIAAQQQVRAQQVGSGTMGWANPVKRMRTDAGKRRPSHL